jgi:hypothetical protein
MIIISPIPENRTPGLNLGDRMISGCGFGQLGSLAVDTFHDDTSILEHIATHALIAATRLSQDKLSAVRPAQPHENELPTAWRSAWSARAAGHETTPTDHAIGDGCCFLSTRLVLVIEG